MSKMSKRQTDCIHFNSTQFEFPTHLSGYVRVGPTRCPMDSLITVVLARCFTPPIHLTMNKYYASRNRIAFKGVLSLACPRAFHLAWNVSSRAIFVAFGFFQCVLSQS